jgi:hypothetical protein
MKKLFKITLVIAIVIQTFSGFAQDFRNQSDEYIQIGYGRYKVLSFGGDASLVPNHGRYAIEYWGGGLNFWRPWPTPGHSNYILFLRDDNNVGIGGTGSSSFKLHVNGLVFGTAFFIGSDQRIKRNIKPLSESQDKLKKLNGVSYEYIAHKGVSKPNLGKELMTEAKEKSFQKNKQSDDIYEPGMGFIAQEVREVFPELVKEDEEGYLSVNYIGLIPYLVEAIKGQQSEIDSLKKLVTKNVIDKGAQKKEGISKVARLDQNVPNPFSQSTTITYSIESDFESAEIIVVDFNGEIKKRFTQLQKGEGSVVLSGGSLNPGTYHYTLIVDGTAIDSKIAVFLK